MTYESGTPPMQEVAEPDDFDPNSCPDTYNAWAANPPVGHRRLWSDSLPIYACEGPGAGPDIHVIIPNDGRQYLTVEYLDMHVCKTPNGVLYVYIAGLRKPRRLMHTPGTSTDLTDRPAVLTEIKTRLGKEVEDTLSNADTPRSLSYLQELETHREETFAFSTGHYNGVYYAKLVDAEIESEAIRCGLFAPTITYPDYTRPMAPTTQGATREEVVEKMRAIVEQFLTFIDVDDNFDDVEVNEDDEEEYDDEDDEDDEEEYEEEEEFSDCSSCGERVYESEAFVCEKCDLDDVYCRSCYEAEHRDHDHDYVCSECKTELLSYDGYLYVTANSDLEAQQRNITGPRPVHFCAISGCYKYFCKDCLAKHKEQSHANSPVPVPVGGTIDVTVDLPY